MSNMQDVLELDTELSESHSDYSHNLEKQNK